MEEIDYAALSYVWGADSAENTTTFQDQHMAKAEATQRTSSALPGKLPKVIEDAIFVCKKLSIPYLWVDRYCIDQGDRVRLASEIQGMGYRYHYAKLTMIAPMGQASDIKSEVGLLPISGSGDMEGLQRVETVQGRKYITALPSIRDQLHRSHWINRAWTLQEGQLSNRVLSSESTIYHFCVDWDTGENHYTLAPMLMKPKFRISRLIAKDIIYYHGSTG
jgi:hypothetical protein